MATPCGRSRRSNQICTGLGSLYFLIQGWGCRRNGLSSVLSSSSSQLPGSIAQYHFAVLGNPCDHPEELSRPFVQPFYGRGETVLTREAPEVRCDQNGQLQGAHLSDHGYIIVSMFFDEDSSLKSMDETIFEGHCRQRAEAGYNSGMGEIFRKVAAISPVPVNAINGLSVDTGECKSEASDQ